MTVGELLTVLFLLWSAWCVLSFLCGKRARQGSDQPWYIDVPRPTKVVGLWPHLLDQNGMPVPFELLHPELFAHQWRPTHTDPDFPYEPPPQAY